MGAEAGGRRAADAIGVVTIDGPAASGKSTVARLVAARLGIPFVSSGLLYRAATFIALEGGGDPAAVRDVLRELESRRVVLRPDVDGNRIDINGRDRTEGLHTDEVDDAVSAVAANPEIRTWVNARLREIGGPFVVEGRDMGRVVFPEARHKFYLTAPARVRARRRLGERAADLAAVAAALQRRDESDAGRLSRAPDALVIDTGELGLEQVVDEVMNALPKVQSG